MPLTLADPQTIYEKDKKLDREDVKTLMEWCEKQPHLPTISELQALVFLHSCYYRIEPTKITLDNFFTVRTMVTELYEKYDANDPLLIEAMDIALLSPLKQKTPENHQVIIAKLMDCNPDRYNYTYQCKLFDMVVLTDIFCKGPKEGLVIVFDLKGGTLSHLAKLNIAIVKKTFYYIQEAIPLRLKGIHIINPVGFIDKMVALIRPFMKKELLEIFYIHSHIEELYKFVPKECLPKDYGGNDETSKHLQGEQNKYILENLDLFKMLNKQKVDENKRPGKPKGEGDIFGMEGSFKKLQVD